MCNILLLLTIFWSGQVFKTEIRYENDEYGFIEVCHPYDSLIGAENVGQTYMYDYFDLMLTINKMNTIISTYLSEIDNYNLTVSYWYDTSKVDK